MTECLHDELMVATGYHANQIHTGFYYHNGCKVTFTHLTGSCWLNAAVCAFLSWNNACKHRSMQLFLLYFWFWHFDFDVWYFSRAMDNNTITVTVHWPDPWLFTENHLLWLRSVQLQFDIFKKFRLVLVLWLTHRSFWYQSYSSHSSVPSTSGRC